MLEPSRNLLIFSPHILREYGAIPYSMSSCSGFEGDVDKVKRWLGGRLKDIQGFIDGVYRHDLHAKRVESSLIPSFQTTSKRLPNDGPCDTVAANPAISGVSLMSGMRDQVVEHAPWRNNEFVRMLDVRVPVDREH